MPDPVNSVPETVRAMIDIVIGVAIMAALSMLTFGISVRLGRSTRTFWLDVTAVSTVLATIFYAFFVWDKLILARLLPVSNLIIVGNWFPLATGLLAGVAWNRVPGATWRKAFSTALLLCVGFFAILQPVMGQPPLCDNKWKDEVCLQTSPTTCSPASAATLLKAFGVTTTEQEMAHLCITRNGTTWQGLYHGLSIMGERVQRKPELFECSLDELRQFDEFPVLLSVELTTEDAGMDLYYENKGGWIPDVPHTVVLFGFDDAGWALIGEPSFGFELWPPKDMDVLWHGRGIRMIPRH